MKFHDLAKKRYSVRRFKSQEVEPEKLEMVLEAGRLAPTACNYQPYKVLVLKTPAGIEKLRKGNPYMYEAPVAIIVCINHEAVWKRLSDGKDYGDIDATIVTDHMMLAAADLGLGSIWMGAFDPQNLRSEFNIPEHYEPVNVLLLGYAADDAAPQSAIAKRRKPLSETVIYESFEVAQ